MVVEPAFGVAAWGIEEGLLSFGKIAVQQVHGHEHGFHAVAPVVFEELLECVRVAGCLPDGPGMAAMRADRFASKPIGPAFLVRAACYRRVGGVRWPV